MALKTDYATGDTLPAADVNAANAKINTNEAALGARPLVVPNVWSSLKSFGGTTDQNYLCFAAEEEIYVVKTDFSELQILRWDNVWAAATMCGGLCIVGNYLYVHLWNETNEQRIYRFDKTNLAAGGTQMTIAGQALATGQPAFLITDGTYLYVHDDNVNKHKFKKGTLSGTTLTLAAYVTCDTNSAAFTYGALTDGTKYFSISNGSVLYRYTMTGTSDIYYSLNVGPTCKPVLFGAKHHLLSVVGGLGFINPQDLGYVGL